MNSQETTTAKTQRTNSKTAEGSKARSKSAAKKPTAAKPRKAPKATKMEVDHRGTLRKQDSDRIRVDAPERGCDPR
jgi:hypothetical protein